MQKKYPSIIIGINLIGIKIVGIKIVGIKMTGVKMAGNKLAGIKADSQGSGNLAVKGLFLLSEER